MKLTSPTLVEGMRMPRTHAKLGANRSPELRWEGAPEGTRSFAVTCYDPDAPTGSGWWHWLVVNLPASVTSLEEGACVACLGGQEVRNDYGDTAFGGACPPKGDGMHRYVFTVWALPVEKLDVTDTTSAALIGFQLNALALAKAKITATYVTE